MSALPEQVSVRRAPRVSFPLSPSSQAVPVIRHAMRSAVQHAGLLVTYAASVLGLQWCFYALTGPHSPLITVISTLVFAAALAPLRHAPRVVRRGLSRRGYDADKTLERFSLVVRDEVDLAAVSDNLLAVVSGTLEPSHVSLWLRDFKHD